MTASGAPLVEGSAIVKGYGRGNARVAAVNSVNIRVERTEYIAITGPSGSGKTTLLHCLAGLATPDSGTVLFDGHDLATLDDNQRTDLRSERMGFVFQTLNLIPALTIAENVELPLVLRGADVETIRSARGRRLHDVGLEARAESYPRELSGGEQQRAAVARALVSDPAIVWADEPTGALDRAAAAGVAALLRAAADAGTAVVIVTHDAELAALADRSVTLVDGRITA